MPSGSDFITSGDESGGGKKQRRRTSKDKPRKSKLSKRNGETNGDGEPGSTPEERQVNHTQSLCVCLPACPCGCACVCVCVCAHTNVEVRLGLRAATY